MPTRRCCGCGPCYRFFDLFDREDSTDIGEDYEVCSGAFEIASSELWGEGEFVVKHSVGTPPFGYMQVELYIIEGVTYRIEAYKGTVANPCSGATTSYLEVECLTDSTFNLRLSGGDGYRACTLNPEYVDQPIPITYCLSDDMQSMFVPTTYAIGLVTGSDSGDPNNICVGGPATGKYFQISVSGGEGRIAVIRYFEHREYRGNADCPYCVLPRCCFPDFEDVIVGFNVTVHNIGDSESTCECQSTITFDVWIPPDESKCKCELRFYTNPTADPLEETTPGPHGCPYGETIVQFAMTCTEEGGICIAIDLILDGPTQSEYNYTTRCFPIGTAPEDVLVTLADPIVLSPTGIGDEQLCIMEDSYITFTPYVSSNGCCAEDVTPEELSVSTRSGARRVTQVVTGSSSVVELPYEQHSELIEHLKQELGLQDRGLGDTATRLIKAQHTLSYQIRRWLKFYACRRSEAVAMINRHFPAKPQ